MLSFSILMPHFMYYYAECHYAEYHYAKYHYAECRGAFCWTKSSLLLKILR
jgi:hypothetical protein